MVKWAHSMTGGTLDVIGVAGSALMACGDALRPRRARNIVCLSRVFAPPIKRNDLEIVLKRRTMAHLAIGAVAGPF